MTTTANLARLVPRRTTPRGAGSIAAPFPGFAARLDMRQFRQVVADRDRLTEQPFDRLQSRPLLVVAEGNCLARHARPARAADAVHVGFRLVG